MEFKPRNVGKGKGRPEVPRNRYHPGFSAPAVASTSQVTLDTPSASSSVSRELDPKREAQAVIKAASAARKAAEAQRLAERADAEAVGLLELSLSDWAVDHAGTGLRMKLGSGDGGFVSLDWLIKSSSVLEHLPASHQQPTALLKALKTCPSELIELRMSLKESSTFDIRRRTPLSSDRLDDATLRARTIYAENLSPRASSLPGLLGSLRDLLPASAGPSGVQAIENVHASKDNDHEKKRMHRLEQVRFVLETPELAESMAREWHWRPAALYGDLVVEKTADESDWRARSRRDARLVGFRTLLWSEFEKRREEYLAYQERMKPAPAPEPEPMPAPTNAPPPHRPAPERAVLPLARPRAQYPEGCLVFVKNVPPDTNKTALKEAFNALLDGASVDYVDWEKGLDTCHVRTSTPDQASLIQKACESRPIVVASSGPTSALSAEVVSGTREEIYWMALPPKIRDNALRALDGVSGGDEPSAKRRRR